MFTFKKFCDSYENIWDEFLNESVNGTFLQSRRFLNYHPKGKFIDSSIMVYDEKNRLCAIVPACDVEENNRRIFYSHKGSTFGGIVISKKYYKAKYLLELIKDLKNFIKHEGFDEIYLKITSEIFSCMTMDLMQYAFYYNGFHEYKELSTYVDYDNYKENILSNLSQGKRTNVHNCEKKNLEIRSLKKEELPAFYGILCENLEKFNAKPVHKIEELEDFLEKRLTNECEFFGCFENDEMIAGSMMFYFHKVNAAHTQYLAARSEYGKLSPMSYVYYSMIKIMKERGFKKISFGIATENLGREINMGLISSKEEYGGQYCNNITYHICL